MLPILTKLKKNNIEYKNLDFMGYPNYYITEEGQLINKNGKVMKTRISNTGYEAIQLFCSVTKKYLNTFIHRLVAKAFIPNPNNYETVDHIDFNPLNNHQNNLQWMCKSTNSQRSWDKGNHNSQKKRVGKYLNDELLATFDSIQDAADSVSIDRNCIGVACRKGTVSRGFYWKFIVDAKDKE